MGHRVEGLMIGSRLADRYELVDELGRGGMGVVYLARDPQLDRQVAVKVLTRSELSTSAEDRFLREAHLVARMDHASIVPIYDLGRDEGRLFFVMPVVRGETLQALKTRGGLALGDILEIIAQVAEALDYSHHQGVVHRDVKPENVMVEMEDGQIRARVMDFGLAFDDTADRLTRTGNLPGTLGYLSPEQITGAEIDGRCDLYSLGTIFYECLAGQPPFSGTRYALLYQIVNQPPPPLRSFGIDAALDHIVMRCLAKSPADRLASCADLAEALRRHASSLSRSGLERDLAAYREELVRPLEEAAPLIGRENHMLALRQRLERAATGECQLVLLAGEAGMGKTRLAEEVTLLARGRGFRVLWGRFADHETAFPFQGFGELIQDFFRVRGGSATDTGSAAPASAASISGTGSALPNLGDLAPELEDLFPALSEIESLRRSFSKDRPQDGVDGRRADPMRWFEVLAQTLIRLAEGRPTLFVLENLHEAEISLEALQYVVRRLAATPCLFLGTYRPTGLPRRHPIQRLIRGFYDDPRFERLALGPLERDEHHRLVTWLTSERQGDEGELPEKLADRLFEATEGNPFFTRELVRSLLEGGELHRRKSGSWDLSGELAIGAGFFPETIQQTVEARLEQLSEECLEVLSAASILGRTFEYRGLEELLGRDIDDVVETLLLEGMLVEDRQARADVLHFSSGVVRDVIYGDLSRRRRRRWHRRYARFLERHWEGRLEQVLPQLVHHFAAGDVAGETVCYALAIARESRDPVRSEAAVRALRTALDFVEDEDPETGASEGELRSLLADALFSSGQHEAAVHEASRAVRLLQPTDPAAAARTARLAAEAAWRGRRTADVRRWVEQGIEMARAADEIECLLKLLVLGATVANLRGEHQKARAYWDEAQELGPAARPQAPPPKGGTLVSALESAPGALDPATAVDPAAREIVATVFETLTEVDAEGHLRPVLAEEWIPDAARRSFRVRLRRGLKFSDGTPLDATAVERVVTARQDLRPPAWAMLEGIENVDDFTLVFHLREPMPIFPLLLSDPRAAVYRSPVARHGDGAGPLVGSGPLRIVSADPERIVLERNRHARRGREALIDRLEFEVCGTAETTAESMRAGRLDMAIGLPGDELDSLLREPRSPSRIVEVTRQSVLLMALNQSGEWTSRPDVRRALIDVLQVPRLIWQHLGRRAQPATTLQPPGLLGHDPGRRRPQLTRVEALELLQAIPGLRLPIELSVVLQPRIFESWPSLIEALVRELSAIGLEIEPRKAARRELSELGDVASDLWIGGAFADYQDADSLAAGLLHSRAGRLGPWVGSAELDELVVAARREEDAAAREIFYRGIEDRLVEERSILPLFYEVDCRICGPQVLKPRLMSRPPFVDYAAIGLRPDAASEAAAGRLEELSLQEYGAVSVPAIHIPLPTGCQSLVPREAHLQGAAEITGTVYETLTKVDEGARIVPNLASEFRLEDGGRRFRFKLRHYVRFHDGRKLTLRDVRFTFEELVRNYNVEGVDPELLPIRGAEAFRRGVAPELAGFEIHSASEFSFVLDRPLPLLPAMLTSPTAAIVPEGETRFAGSWRDGCSGTGPFRVERFLPGQRLELEANAHYWRRGLPVCERLVFDLGVDLEEAADGLREGRYGAVPYLRPATVEALRQEPAFAAGYHEAPGFATFFLALDLRRGALADPRVGATVSRILRGLALRTTEFLGRLALPARGLIPPGFLGHEAHDWRERDEQPANERPAEVREQLSGVELRIAVFPAYLNELRPFWNAAIAALEQAGARVEVLRASPVEALWRIAQSEVDLAGVHWVASYPDPDALIHFFHSRGLLGPLVSEEKLDELFTRGRSETDPTLRHSVYRQIDRILAEHPAIVPLCHNQAYCFSHPDLSGLRLRFGWPEVAYEELVLKR